MTWELVDLRKVVSPVDYICPYATLSFVKVEDAEKLVREREAFLNELANQQPKCEDDVSYERSVEEEVQEVVEEEKKDSGESAESSAVQSAPSEKVKLECSETVD